MINPDEAGPSNGFRVLVVDDEPEFVATLVKRLRKRGLTCEGVCSGALALEAISREAFEVMLLDMRMPDLDGSAVLREVKRLKPETRVILLTGHISTQDGMTGFDQGAHDYLTKPVEFESLLETLRSARLPRAA